MPVVWAMLAVMACSGGEFRPQDDAPCTAAACAGSSSGTSSVSNGGASGAVASAGTGGASAAGSSGMGVTEGGGPAAGSGSGAAGEEAAGGETGAEEFPATDVLDDFDRVGPEPGAAWTGAVENYSLVEAQLWCEECAGAALWSVPFGEDQEVYATLSTFDAVAPEVNLVLKAQGSSSCELIEILYSPLELQVRVDYCVDGVWTQLEPASLLLKPGDRLGGRAHADGTVEIFANGELVSATDVSAFPYGVGRIGVNGLAGEAGLYWDDFGGGEWQ